MDAKGDSDESSERKEGSYTESFYQLREYTDHHEQDASRNVNIKDASGKVSDGNEEHVIGNWRRGYPCHTVAKNVAELSSVALLCGR